MRSSAITVSIEQFCAPTADAGDCTDALQSALDSVGRDGNPGGTVVIPPGQWECGSVVLRSGTTLHLEEGAILRASPIERRYPHYRHDYPSRMDAFPRRALFYGCGLRDVALTGAGVIEAGGGHAIFQDAVGDSPDRPYGLHLVECQNVRIEGLTWRDSAYWMMRLFQCRDVTLRSLTIFNHCNINNDGIDVDSAEDVVIEDCRVDTSDDGIVIKAESPRACRRVRVSRCVVSSHASALKVGTGSVGGFEDILFEDCEIRPSASAEMHHVFGYWQGMTGLDVAQVDGGTARNISFRRMFIRGVANLIFVRLGNRQSTISIPANRRREEAGPALEPIGPGSLDNVEFADIEAVDVGPFPAVLSGYEGHPIRNVVLRNVRLSSRAWKAPAGWDREPDWNSAAYPCVHLLADGGCLPAAGLVLRFVEGLRSEGVQIEVDPMDPREPSLTVGDRATISTPN